MIRVQCPYCQRRYRTEMEAFGRTAVCTKCSRAFKIGASRPPFQWKHTDLAEDSWIGVPEPEVKKEMKHCLMCDAPLRPEMIRCPECGANQVTGLVRKTRRREEADEIPFWSTLPLRPIAIFLVIVLVGAGLFWGAKAIGRKGLQLGDEVADTSLNKRVATQLDAGEDPAELTSKYAGMVKDSNLERFAQMLVSGTPTWRRAAALLIGAGQETDLTPVVAVARSKDIASAAAGQAALAAVGARRLVELSNHENAPVRRAAADALVTLFGLEGNAELAKQLAEPSTAAAKIAALNHVCRPWPDLLGVFVVQIGETVSPFQVQVEQIGRTFYLQVGREEFVSASDKRQFTIPIHRWCAATGPAVDARSARELLTGDVILAAPTGALWEGGVQFRSRTGVLNMLPGFLPMDPPPPGQVAQAPARLIRPAWQG